MTHLVFIYSLTWRCIRWKQMLWKHNSTVVIYTPQNNREEQGPVLLAPPGTSWTLRIRAPTGHRLLGSLGLSLPGCVFLFVLLAVVLSPAVVALPPASAVTGREKRRGDHRLVGTQEVPDDHRPFQPPSETQSYRQSFAIQTLATLQRRSSKRKSFISENKRR